jgi:type 1 fimbria pilin
MSGIKLSQLQELTSIDVTSNDILLLACDETGPYTSATISLNTLYNSFNISSTTANTGDWTWPYLNGGFTRANLGGSQGAWIDGQSPGGTIVYNDSTVTLTAGNNSLWLDGTTGNINLSGTIVHSTNSIGIGGISRVAAVTLDVTKSIHKLTSGWYYLPDGIEGQLTYLTLATGSTPLDIKVDFQHARLNESANAPYDNGPIFSNVFGNAYDVSANARPPSLVTAIFIDGAWVCSPDGVWD